MVFRNDLIVSTKGAGKTHLDNYFDWERHRFIMDTGQKIVDAMNVVTESDHVDGRLLSAKLHIFSHERIMEIKEVLQAMIDSGKYDNVVNAREIGKLLDLT